MRASSIVFEAAKWYPPTAEQVEGYKEHFKKWGVMGLEKFPLPSSHASLNDPVGVPEIPSTKLFSTLLQETINDALGIGYMSQETCVDCHLMDLHCGCKSRMVTVKDFDWNKSTDDVYWLKKRLHGIHPTVNPKRIVEIDGKWYNRMIRSTCSSAHTNQECARRWFKEGQHREICELLNLDPDYVLKMVERSMWEGEAEEAEPKLGCERGCVC